MEDEQGRSVAGTIACVPDATPLDLDETFLWQAANLPRATVLIALDRRGSVSPVDRWHLPSIDATGKREPRLLFSTPPACRAVVIDLTAGETMSDHSVHENAIVQVVSGTVRLGTAEGETECAAGTLATFAPGERHSITAVETARLLLLLAPWPGDGHYAAGKAEHLAENVRVPPLTS